MQLSFYPEPEQYQKLKALSALTGVPQQVYLRQGLQFVLREEQARPGEGALSLQPGRTGRRVWLQFLGQIAQRDKLWAETQRLTDRSIGKVWPGDRRGKAPARTLRSRRRSSHD